MSDRLKHIAICICTYKRPHLLKRLLSGLEDQDTGGLFTYSIVIVDNDSLQSAKSIVSDFSATSRIPVRYYVEPRQNIALARNKAVENASGDFIAFIDDDELPTKKWMLTLFAACNKYNAAGALGPVKPLFDEKPPDWLVKAKFYDRPTYPTGFVIEGRMGRTGNVLLKMEIFHAGNQHFKPEFRTGEDQDFFRRMIEKGYVFIWCNEAVAYEIVSPIRWKLSFLIRRALLRGATTRAHPTFGVLSVIKSIIAVSIYTIALPFALLVNRTYCIVLFIKLFDHLGKILACIGIEPIKDAYVTD